MIQIMWRWRWRGRTDDVAGDVARTDDVVDATDALT